LEVRTDKPLAQAQLDTLARLETGVHGLLAIGKARSRTLSVSLTMSGGDVVGALARSLNVVLDVVPGTVRLAEVVERVPHSVSKRRRR
jgi:hypothetical protein